MAYRPSKRYPKYDWSGIAMLTQQLGGLFEPSKGKLLREEQEHEMRKLEAKQAWKLGSEQLEYYKTEGANALKNLQKEQEKLQVYGSEVMDVAKKDFSMPEESSIILDDNDARTLDKLNSLTRKHSESYFATQKKLNEIKDMNESALAGKHWSNTLEAESTEERTDVKGKNYKTIHDADRSGTLSWEEQGNALRDYINDYYQPAEGEEGITINIGGEDIMATPEALAFKAGFEHVRGREKADTKEMAVSKPGLKATGKLNEWFNLDAAWMNLPDTDKDEVIDYLKSALPEAEKPKLSLHLQDSMLQKKHMDQLSKGIGGSGFNDRIQTLNGSYWGTPATVDDKFDFGTGMRDVDIPAVVRPWEEAGLNKEMYTNIRRMGAKAGVTRGAFEHALKNWDSLNDSERSLAVAQILSEYKTLIGL